MTDAEKLTAIRAALAERYEETLTLHEAARATNPNTARERAARARRDEACRALNTFNSITTRKA